MNCSRESLPSMSDPLPLCVLNPWQMLAAAQGLPIVVQALLCAMSPEEASQRNSHGMSAADVAQEYKHQEIHDIITNFLQEREEALAQQVSLPQGGETSGERAEETPPPVPLWP